MHKLLYLGILSPLLFWLTTFLCGFLLEDYRHLSHLVSELGAQGAATQHLFSAGLVLSAILNACFVYALWLRCRQMKASIAPLIFMFCYSFLAGPAIVPMPLPLHGIIGLPFPLIMLAPLFALILWGKQMPGPHLRIMAVTSLMIMLAGFLIWFPDILPAHFGLKQRFLYLGWSAWSCAVAVRFLRTPVPPGQGHGQTSVT